MTLPVEKRLARARSRSQPARGRGKDSRRRNRIFFSMISGMSTTRSPRSGGERLTRAGRVTSSQTSMTLPAVPNVLPLEGEIDLHVSPRVAKSLAEMIERKPQRLVVDLSRVSYIDSSGLAVLIEGMQNVEEYGGKFILAGLQENVRPIFEIARLDQVFIIFPHVDAALAAILKNIGFHPVRPTGVHSPVLSFFS